MKRVVYKGCSDLPIYNFYKIIETKNFSYLYVHWDEYEEDIKEHEDDDKLWRNIYNDYCKLTNDNKTLLYYDLILEISWFKSRIQVVTKLLNQLMSGEKTNERVSMYVEEINKWKFSIDKSRPLVDEVQKVLRGLNISQNKIRLKEQEVENLRLSDEEKEDVAFMKQLVQLERSSGRNEIDPKKTSVEKWVAIILDTKELQEQKAKAHGRK